MLVAADVRRRIFVKWRTQPPPPHVGGYFFDGLLTADLLVPPAHAALPI
jgi:hypothetical protein